MSFKFVVSLFVLTDIFAVTLPLANRLQSKQVDIASAVHIHMLPRLVKVFNTEISEKC